MNSQFARNLPRRGIYILPSILTTGNIFCGLYAITTVWSGEFDSAAKAIGIAIVLDGFDGRVARMTGATSKFGLQLDSLADAISFGVAPAIVTWGWQLRGLNYLGWIACFIYLVCGVMRLARFNIQTPGQKHFAGLPIPAAAGLIAALVHFADKYRDWNFFKKGYQLEYFLLFLVFLLAFFMISTFRYPSFKNINFLVGKSYITILFIACFITIVWFFSHEVLLLTTLGYFLSGIADTIRRRLFPRLGKSTN